MLLEDLRNTREDLERLEQAIAERSLEDPKHVSVNLSHFTNSSSYASVLWELYCSQSHISLQGNEDGFLRRYYAIHVQMLIHSQIRDRLQRDHQIAAFLDRIKSQSNRAVDLYKDNDGSRLREVQSISTGDTFDEFYKQLNHIKDFHKRYPNEPVENLERAYKRRAVGEDAPFPSEIDTMFTGEEAFGRYFDMNALHEDYINLPGSKRRITYLQYLDTFDEFDGMSRPEKLKDQYFQYLGNLATYLESFMRRIKPLEDLDRLFLSFDEDFLKLWEKDEVPGWQLNTKSTSDAPATEGTGEGMWCPDCEKEFKNDNVYKGHLTGKKHIKNAEARKQRAADGEAASTNGSANTAAASMHRLKERPWPNANTASVNWLPPCKPSAPTHAPTSNANKA